MIESLLCGGVGFCFWLGGFFFGYGLRGFIFSRQKKKIIDDMMDELKKIIDDMMDELKKGHNPQ